VSDESDRPALQVIRGDATAEEIAALLAVVAARCGRRSGGPPAPSSAWDDRSNALRTLLAHGPGAWRASALPR
jgi:hypothetical protein